MNHLVFHQYLQYSSTSYKILKKAQLSWCFSLSEIQTLAENSCVYSNFLLNLNIKFLTFFLTIFPFTIIFISNYCLYISNAYNQKAQLNNSIYDLILQNFRWSSQTSNYLQQNFSFRIFLLFSLNLNFLYSIVELYLRPISIKEMMEGASNQNPAGLIDKRIKLLQKITSQISRFLPAYLLLAKGKLAVGNDIDASVSIAKDLQINTGNEEGYIIQAIIKQLLTVSKNYFSQFQNQIKLLIY